MQFGGGLAGLIIVEDAKDGSELPAALMELPEARCCSYSRRTTCLRECPSPMRHMTCDHRPPMAVHLFWCEKVLLVMFELCADRVTAAAKDVNDTQYQLRGSLLTQELFFNRSE